MPFTNSTPPFYFALTGFPLGHSLSPVIHNAALKACGLAGEYTLRPIPPDQIQDGLGLLVAEIRRGVLHGLNVTIPYKQSILPFCDELTPAARSIGAANLIFLEGQKIIGDNSDARGFLAALQPFVNKWKQRKALVLGAGGSARAVAYGLASGGWDVSLSARRPEQARQLLESLHLPQLPPDSAIAYPPQSQDLQYFDLLVNTTPLGMYPNPDGCPWPLEAPLPAGSVVYDLVYNPRQTRLLRLAAAQGLPCISGITMLIEQAAIAFERWTGLPAPRSAMTEAVR